MIRVFLVDDQSLVRAGLRLVIDSQSDMEVVGEAGDGRAALEALGVTTADVVLMDVRMPELDGVGALKRLIERDGDAAPRVVMLTTFDLDEYVFSALRAGASGFLLKDAEPEDLLAAIRAVATGDAVIAPSATRRLLEQVADRLPGSTADPRLEELTERERAVLLEVTRGASNAEVGEALFMAEATVKTHVGRLLSKLGLRDRVQLVVFAYESGLVRPGSDRKPPEADGDGLVAEQDRRHEHHHRTRPPVGRHRGAPRPAHDPAVGPLAHPRRVRLLDGHPRQRRGGPRQRLGEPVRPVAEPRPGGSRSADPGSRAPVGRARSRLVPEDRRPPDPPDGGRRARGAGSDRARVDLGVRVPRLPRPPDMQFSHDGWHVLLVVCYAPLVLWAPLLAAVTYAYWRRRS